MRAATPVAVVVSTVPGSSLSRSLRASWVAATSRQLGASSSPENEDFCQPTSTQFEESPPLENDDFCHVISCPMPWPLTSLLRVGGSTPGTLRPPAQPLPA